MIKIYSNTKVFVYAPYNCITGGVELLHQLVDFLNRNNIASYIAYDNNGTLFNADVPVEYSKYSIKTCDSIEDKPENVVVIPETLYNRIYNTEKTQKLFWWLSIDNYYQNYPIISVKDLFCWNTRRGIKQAIRRFVLRCINPSKLEKTVSLKLLKNSGGLHCYQSEYAQHFLQNKKIEELLPLSDFINTDFFGKDKPLERKRKVLYNPKKGFKYTKKLIKNSPKDILWVPLINLNREQLINEFKSSMLYIDFGHHPGKDRIPREAALNGCCVLTNRVGAAGFFEDVAIFQQYKISEKAPVKDILNKINYMLNNFESITDDFDFYRNRILKEKEIFENQIREIFNIHAE